ncbi:MAG TPA: hypothetical protein VHX43_18370, partial [Xanthobacteraceae bacterium]|nr:hypothetical protein [Xanthobacteraceae bacterium]
RCKAGLVKSAVDIGAALDGVALIEVRVKIDEGRPDLPAPDIDACCCLVAIGARAFDAGEVAVFDQQIDAGHALAVTGAHARKLIVQQTQRYARIHEPIAARGGPGNISKTDRHLAALNPMSGNHRHIGQCRD